MCVWCTKNDWQQLLSSVTEFYLWYKCLFHSFCLEMRWQHQHHPIRTFVRALHTFRLDCIHLEVKIVNNYYYYDEYYYDNCMPHIHIHTHTQTLHKTVIHYRNFLDLLHLKTMENGPFIHICCTLNAIII